MGLQHGAHTRAARRADVDKERPLLETEVGGNVDRRASATERRPHPSQNALMKAGVGWQAGDGEGHCGPP